MGSRAAKSAPAPTVPRRPPGEAARPSPSAGDGSTLGELVSKLVEVLRDEARRAVREALDAERARQTDPATEEWLTTADVAARLGRSDKTVRHWIQARGLRAQKHLGVWRVRRVDLDAFITGTGESPEGARAAAILAELHHG